MLRTEIADLFVSWAKKHEKAIFLTADHGYSIFDPLRKECPDQFINCGVSEQAMIGVAAGLAKQGYFPIVYGLASFIPIKVLEQIKIDLCQEKLPVCLIGDGYGYVYSKLGPTHWCTEAFHVLRPYFIDLYSAYTIQDLEDVFYKTAIHGTSYVSIGKECLSIEVNHDPIMKENLIISHGSMIPIAEKIAKKYDTQFWAVQNIRDLSCPIFNEHRMVFLIDDSPLESSVYGFINNLNGNVFHIGASHNPTYCNDYENLTKEISIDFESIDKKISAILS